VFNRVVMRKNKYRPLILVSIFTIGGLMLSLLLSFARLLFEGGEFLDVIARLEPVIFLACVGIIIGFAYCEISNLVQSKILGAILFGAVSSQLFVGCLLVSL